MDSALIATKQFSNAEPATLTLGIAAALRLRHRKLVQPWVLDRVTRASRASWHPVYDFLFSYYPYRPSKLERWSPGCDVTVVGATPADLDWSDHWVHVDAGCVIPSSSFPDRRLPYIKWALEYLTRTADRVPYFGCFGLHEWAMVYRSPTVRHDYVPLRLSEKQICEIVEAGELRCSHYDAFRFFTQAALSRNRTQLTREDTIVHDQRGCVHVSMDLYKFAHKIAPWSSSELVANTFLLAAQAREIDMRASPYDLSMYGFSPIKIEEREGREEYVSLQRALAEAAVPLRSQLVTLYRRILESLLTPNA